MKKNKMLPPRLEVEEKLTAVNLSFDSIKTNFRDLGASIERSVANINKQFTQLKEGIVNAFNTTKNDNNTILRDVITNLKGIQGIDARYRALIVDKLPGKKPFEYSHLCEPQYSDDGFLATLSDINKTPDVVKKLRDYASLAKGLKKSLDAIENECEAMPSSGDGQSRKDQLSQCHTVLYRRLMMILDKYFRTRLWLYEAILNETTALCNAMPRDEARTFLLKHDADAVIEHSQNQGRKFK